MSLAIGIVSILILTNTVMASNLNTNSKSDKKWTLMMYFSLDEDVFPQELYDKFIDFFFKHSLPSNRNINTVILLDTGRCFLAHGKNIRPFRLKLEILEEYDEINCGNYTTLRDFILRCKKEFPAERYFLHIHGHGYAWYGACSDNDTNDTEFPKDRLTMKEIRTALEESGGVDILEFTNCVMGNLESAYELRNCTKFYIGSESGVDTFSPAVALINNLKMFRSSYFRSTEIIAKKVVQSFKYGLFHLYRCSPVYFILDVLNLYKYDRFHKYFTFSTIKTNKLDNVCEAIDEISEFLINNIDEYKDNISSVRNQTEDFGSPLIDIYHFADVLNEKTSNIPEQDLNPIIDALKKSLDEAIITEWHQIGYKKAHGLTLYFPTNKYGDTIWTLENYSKSILEFTDNTQWDEFLELYFGS